MAFQKYTFSGVMPKSGTVGRQIDAIIDELQGLDLLPTTPVKEAAE